MLETDDASRGREADAPAFRCTARDKLTAWNAAPPTGPAGSDPAAGRESGDAADSGRTAGRAVNGGKTSSTRTCRRTGAVKASRQTGGGPARFRTGGNVLPTAPTEGRSNDGRSKMGDPIEPADSNARDPAPCSSARGCSEEPATPPPAWAC